MTCNEETFKKAIAQLFLPYNAIILKTEKLNRYGESLPGSLWKKRVFRFSVFQFFRKYSGIVPEPKLKN